MIFLKLKINSYRYVLCLMSYEGKAEDVSDVEIEWTEA